MSSAAATRSTPVADRPDGSRRGRPSIDWEEAFGYYASLPDAERSYGAVAEHYGISVRTVEAHGRKEHWRERLAQIKAKAAETADVRLAAERAEKLAEIDLLIDASLTTYAQQIRAGTVKVVPGDLLRLYKLRAEVWAQNDVERDMKVADEVAEQDPVDAEQRKRDLIVALEEAGFFERLRNLSRPPTDDDVSETTDASQGDGVDGDVDPEAA